MIQCSPEYFTLHYCGLAFRRSPPPCPLPPSLEPRYKEVVLCLFEVGQRADPGQVRMREAGQSGAQSCRASMLRAGTQGASQGAAQPWQHEAPSGRDEVRPLGFPSHPPVPGTPSVLSRRFPCRRLLWGRVLCRTGRGVLWKPCSGGSLVAGEGAPTGQQVWQVSQPVAGHDAWWVQRGLGRTPESHRR